MFICLPEDKQTGIQIIIEEEFTHCIKEYRRIQLTKRPKSFLLLPYFINCTMIIMMPIILTRA